MNAKLPPSDHSDTAVTDALSRLAGGYELMAGALSDMGFGEQDGIPPYEPIRDVLIPLAGWLATRNAAGHQDELVIAPSLQAIGLMGDPANPGIIPRFDKKQSSATQVEGPISKFGDRDPIHDNGTESIFSAAILLGDTTAPHNPGSAANSYGEPGLVYTDTSVADQRQALLAERRRHAAAGRVLADATIAQIVMTNASRRLSGKPMLDGPTQTRLTHYPNHNNNRVGTIPRVDSHVPSIPEVDPTKVRLWLQGSRVKVASPDAGVRRVLRLPIERS